MTQDNNEPNVVRIVRSTEAPNVWHCSHTVDFDTPEGAEMQRKILSPEGVLHWLHYAIASCWLALPDYNKNLATLLRETKRLMELTIENLHARPQAFGIDSEPMDPGAEEFRSARFLGDPVLMMLHFAVETCCQILPVEQRSVDSVEREARKLFERALESPLSAPEFPQMIPSPAPPRRCQHLYAVTPVATP